MIIVHFWGIVRAHAPENIGPESEEALFGVKEEMERLIAKNPRGIDGFEEPSRASSQA